MERVIGKRKEPGPSNDLEGSSIGYWGDSLCDGQLCVPKGVFRYCREEAGRDKERWMLDALIYCVLEERFCTIY